MEGPITPVNATRTERVQGPVNTPIDPQKLATLRAKLELPPPPAVGQTGGELGADQVIISEMGKALCRFAQTLERDPRMLEAFTAGLPPALQQAVQEQGGRPVNYDMALQLCMALYGPEVRARAATYGRDRSRRIDRYAYYRALMEHFGLQYDGDAPDADEESGSLWDRFMKRLHAMVAGGGEPGAQEPHDETADGTEASGAPENAPSAGHPAEKPPNENKPPRLWP
ncbi:hypothetical protein [Ethanoligenens harbinense]|nr:hypothetical protein [Ethanoligenens harbinense]AVQ97125.1 hypothetical protein CXQ68_13475 [Ethanoligenens harbinense YUAN-3]AYF39787.1 hypothetical protein CXP51_13375 [Ethanoligenens harbinense]QCN93368.1 hypothetical protein DRA42_13525 [Ethanoligenens harbinense]